MDLKLFSKLLSTISLPNEPLLEKWARLFRFQAVVPRIVSYLSSHSGLVTLVDFGCGQDILLKKYLDFLHPTLSHRIRYIGIDPLVKTKTVAAGVEIIKEQFESVRLKQKADIVVMLAVLEHVDSMESLLSHATSLIKPHGFVIGTTPTPIAKYFLEFFSHQLGVISVREINEHKRYPTEKTIAAALNALQQKEKRRVILSHSYFELGLNNLFVLSHRD